MMEDWKTYKLGEITSWKSGGTPPKFNPDYWGGNIPWISAKSLKGRYIFDSDTKITEEGLRKGSRIALKGSILFLVRGSGLFNDIPVAMASEDVAFNQDVKCVIPKNEKLTNDFLLYWFKGNKQTFTNMLEATSIGAGKFDQDRLFQLDVNLPPLPEQRAIASILSALDDKIELNLQTNKTLEEMAMTLYKHWFVDFGPFQDGNFVDSELGMIPEGWEVKRLGELYRTTSGGTPSRTRSDYYEGGTIPWVKSKELYGNFVISSEEKITSNALKNSSAKLIPAKSVLLAMYGATVGESSILSMESTCNQAICGIIKKEISHIYVFHFLRFFKSEILNQAVGSAQQNISQEIIKNFKMVSPPADLPVFSKMEFYFDLIEQNLIENQTLTTLRDTLLPKLISGEVRVREAEKILSNSL
jgi:type I restriction enzyme S subunit